MRVCLFVLLCIASVVYPQTPKVEAKSETNGIAQAGQQADSHKKATPKRMVGEKKKPDHGTKDGGRQENECQKGNSEYGMYVGYCLKRTDFYLAVFNGLLVVATFGLIWTGLLEFYATHRPRLVIRRPTFIEGSRPHIRIAITNVGDSSARIVQSDIRVQLSMKNVEMPARPDYTYPSNNAVGKMRVKIGGTGHFDAPIETEDDVFTLKGQDLYRIALIGFLLYKNFGGVRGYTAFCRIWDRELQEFIKPEVDERIPEYDRYEYIN